MSVYMNGSAVLKDQTPAGIALYEAVRKAARDSLIEDWPDEVENAFEIKLIDVVSLQTGKKTGEKMYEGTWHLNGNDTGMDIETAEQAIMALAPLLKTAEIYLQEADQDAAKYKYVVKNGDLKKLVAVERYVDEDLPDRMSCTACDEEPWRSFRLVGDLATWGRPAWLCNVCEKLSNPTLAAKLVARRAEKDA